MPVERVARLGPTARSPVHLRQLVVLGVGVVMLILRFRPVTVVLPAVTGLVTLLGVLIAILGAVTILFVAIGYARARRGRP